jgi:hypothetical protein
MEMEEPQRAWAVWSFGFSPVRKARVYCFFPFSEERGLEMAAGTRNLSTRRVLPDKETGME